MNLFPFKVYIPWFPNCKYVASDSCLFRKSCSDICLACGTCSIWSWVNPCHLWGNNRKIHRNESKAKLLPTCQQPFRFSEQLYDLFVLWKLQAWGQIPKQIQTHIRHQRSGICVLRSFVLTPPPHKHTHIHTETQASFQPWRTHSFLWPL